MPPVCVTTSSSSSSFGTLRMSSPQRHPRRYTAPVASMESATFHIDDMEHDHQHYQQHSSSRKYKRQGIMTVKTLQESLFPTTTQRRDAKQDRLAKQLQRHHDMQGGVVVSPLHVRFSTIVIRNYPITLGDNPGGTFGPPIALDWEHDSEVCVNVDDYERTRPLRRTSDQMQLPQDVRLAMLRNAGLTRQQLMEGTRRVNIARQQRLRTKETMAMAPLQLLGEKFSKKTLNILTFGERKRKERKLLQPFMEENLLGKKVTTTISKTKSTTTTMPLDDSITTVNSSVATTEDAVVVLAAVAADSGEFHA